jgi:UDP-N-acetylglucosamine 2-epimerase (non-hydrolysing)
VRVLSVVGTRPQLVKAVPVSRALRAAGHEEIVLHTGQHYDPALSEAAGAGMSEPARRLDVRSGLHGARGAAIARGTAAFIAEVAPRCVLVVGDTDSALAAGLGARAAGVPLVHGEAGVRLGSLGLPEEINRVALDHIADLLLCPTERAVRGVTAEGATGEILFAGDPLLDAMTDIDPPGAADDAPEAGTFFLATVHRAENTDDADRLARILRALDGLPAPVLFPMHPRTAAAAAAAGGLPVGGSLRVTPPLPRERLLALLRRCRAVLTDSGGVQREAYWLGVPSLVLRADAEWREILDAGWSVTVDASPERIAAAAARPPRGAASPDRDAFGGGRAAARWVEALERRYGA